MNHSTLFFRRAARWLSLAVCFGVAAQAAAQKFPARPGAKAAPRAERMDDFIRLFQTEQGGVSRFYDLPWSEARFDRLEQLHQDWLERLRAVDFDALDQAGRIDYLLLRNKLNAELSRLALERRRLAEMADLISFRAPLQQLERTRWRMDAVDAPAAASAVSALPEQIKKLRARIEKGKKSSGEKPKEPPAPENKAAPPDSAENEKKDDARAEPGPLKVSPMLAKRAAAAAGEIRETLKRWFSFYDGYQPDFSWWLKKPYEEAAKALDDYAKFLREDIADIKGRDEDPLLGEAVGADELAANLASEMLPYGAEELIAIGEREFAWCEAEMKKAAAQMGFAGDWPAALAQVKTLHAPPGRQDTLIADLAREAIQFVKQRELVTVPPLCEETWRLTMISPEGQKTMPYAAYGGQNMMVAYAKDEMKHEDKLMSMRGNNRHFTRIVTAHELIPGHHLQLWTAQRERPYRSLFSTPFLVEGWALYWEIRLWDLDYPQSPEDRVGMLFWRMHRAARIIVSLKFHLGQMKPAEMADFLVQRVGHEKLGATSEVRRFIGGGYSPLYQCGYMIGGLQLRALHQELVGSGQMKERQFNDAVLAQNSIPVEFIRAALLNLPLSRETRAAWRFAP